MAIYYLGMKTFGRARGKTGSRATSGAAYRSGERIRDERTGAAYDHRRRRDVMHKEIVLPTRFAAAGPALNWARNRSALWNAAELVERRKNARVAREFTVALPHELAPERRVALARRFAQELSDRYGNAIDLAIHAPRGDPRNFHAHLFATTREVMPQGLGPKTTLELSGTERHRRGLSRWAEELAFIHERWAELTNETLKEAHLEARITPLSRAQALQRASVPRLPLAAYHMERRGQRSFIAERMREKHSSELARAGPGQAKQMDGADAARPATRAGKTIVEQLRTRAQAAWTALRSRFQEPRVPGKQEQRIVVPERAHQMTRSQAARSAEVREVSTLRPNEVALESARNWVAYRREALRKGNEQPSPEQSVRNWLAYRQSGRGMSDERSHEAPERERTRGHDYDLGL